MDFNDYWQENKRFVTGVVAGVVVFLIGYWMISASFQDEISEKNRQISRHTRDLREPMFTRVELEEAERENAALKEAVDTLVAATQFRPRPEFTLDPGKGAASGQYLRALSTVRDDLQTRTNRANLTVEPGLGMPQLSPTRDVEIVRYLEALDVIESVIGLAIDARAQRVDRIAVRLDPGLTSREGLGRVERTRVSFTVTGTSLALTRLLTWTQRPQGETGRAFHVHQVELAPSRSKEDEVHMDLTLVVARISAAPEEDS